MRRIALLALTGSLALAVPLAALAQTTRDRRFSFFWFGSRSGTASLYQRTPKTYKQNCEKKALLPALLPGFQLQCGPTGSTTPGLIWGDCPITACMIVPTQKTPAFGGPL